MASPVLRGEPPPENSLEQPLDLKEKKKRKREWVAIVLLVLLFIGLTIAEFELTTVSSSFPFLSSILFFALLNINIIILIALVWLVFRNLGKLFIERRRKVLGARLKTKLVVAFLSFSIIPTLVLFTISAVYINSSFDRWFSVKIQNTLQTSLEITRTYYVNTEHTAMHFAEHLASSVLKKWDANAVGIRSEEIRSYLGEQRELLALDAVEFYTDPLLKHWVSSRSDGSSSHDLYPRLPLEVLSRAFRGEKFPMKQHIGTGDVIRGVVPILKDSSDEVLAVVVVSSYIPVGLSNKVEEIAAAADEYRDINPLKSPMKTTFFVILIMITLVILFVAIWVGIFLAKELTGPVERLVYGAQAVGAGNLDVQIPAVGHDEIATLVQSFNRMTHDLKDNREQLVRAGNDLERRRKQLEAVLENINAGVISVDQAGIITTFNPAASRHLNIPFESAIGRFHEDLLVGENLALSQAISKVLQTQVRNQQISPESTQMSKKAEDGVTHTLSCVVTPVQVMHEIWGTVVVVDDMTHLVKGQREMAWREVARRIAHEIKNPLTPIKLSAQRLQRRFSKNEGRVQASSENLALLQECTETIIKHADELKEMVNEFSNFARFPEVNPAPHDLNQAVGEVVKLFQQAHPDIQMTYQVEQKLPIFDFDRDQIKRVLMNLLDNSIAAIQSLDANFKKGQKSIQISTHHHSELQIAVIDVSDNGPGMTEEVKSRVFEPYFSTKKEGTGLGLAIVKRIINDHDGFIRVYSSPGEGTQFIIELPTSPKIAVERRKSRTGLLT